MTAYSKKEKLKIEVSNAREEREHFHQDFELLFVLEGTLDVTVGEQVTHMKEEDLLVVNAGKKHSLVGSENILFARLYITYQLISDIFESNNIIFWCDSVRRENERYDELRDAMKQLLNHYLSSQGGVANFGHIALCYRVMDILSVHFLVKPGDKEGLDDMDKFEDRIMQINHYIRVNYNQPISMKDLSEKLYLSNGYLSRFFKKNYGMSFAEYLTNIRLFHAVDDLLYTNTPITRVAFDNGFASVAVFNKVFKNAYGKTPSSFRKQSHEEKREELSGDKQILEERLETFLRNDGLKRERQREVENRPVEYNAKKYVPTQFFWNDMINIGSASDLLRSEIREHTVFLKEALHFRYVRFWNIFSDELLINLDSNAEQWNFSRLDSILDFLLTNGLKPHIELGMKPKRVLRNVRNYLIQEAGRTAFSDETRWGEVIDILMRHLIHRYGRRELQTWRMELWFWEEVSDQDEDAERYLDVFDVVYKVIHKYSKGIQIGGCGFRLDYLLKKGKSFLKKWKEREATPDYLSFTYYAYERGEIDEDYYAKRLTDNEGVRHNMQRVKMLLQELDMQNMPVYFTEWNLTISDRNYINDTCFKGAYIMKNILDAYGEAESMAYFPGSDRISEYYDTGSILYGGMGIYTKDGIMKPAAFAYDFLNRLYPYYIGKGENYLITTDSQDVYGIVCHNQKKLNYNYYLSAEDEIDRANIWKYFENRKELELQIRLMDVEPGKYQLKMYRINEQNGSVLDLWMDMEFESEITRNDIKYFRRICEPKLTIKKQQTQDRCLQIGITMEPNEITFIKIRKLE